MATSPWCSRESRPSAGAASAAQPAQRVDSGDQRAKDSDSRLILESELKKAEARQVELLKEYNNGEPEKLGPEHRNHQKYLDRVAELKASISRNESDIEGIRRELGRVPGGFACALQRNKRLGRAQTGSSPLTCWPLWWQW